jgi:hypothetical protein
MFRPEYTNRPESPIKMGSRIVRPRSADWPAPIIPDVTPASDPSRLTFPEPPFRAANRGVNFGSIRRRWAHNGG